MKITVSKSELYNKLKSLSRIIQPKNMVAAYDNFLFEVDSTEVLSVTAGEEGGRISTSVACRCDGFGVKFLVNAKTLLDAMSGIPEQPLVFTISNKKRGSDILCEYSGDKGKFTLVGGDAEDYPSLNQTFTTPPILINVDSFLYGLQKTVFCASEDELRPIMGGVLVEKKGEIINYVGCNGQKLGEVTTDHDGDNVEIRLVIPVRYARILAAIISLNPEGEISLSSNSTNIQVSNEDFTLSCRIIEGRYPNYKSVIPTNNHIRATINNAEFIAALKRVSVFSSESKLVSLGLRERNKLEIRCVDRDYDRSAEEVIHLIDSNTDDDFTIGFNSSYLYDLVNNMPCKESILSFSDSSKPVLITRNDEDQSSLTYLLMPLFINA